MTKAESMSVNINGSMFKRSGAWFGLFQKGSIYGDTALHLGTCHGIAAKAPDKNKLIDIYPTYEGRKVPYTIKTVPAEMTLVTSHGNVRFTFADKTKLMAEGDAGMGLLFEKTMAQHETVHPRKNGAWEAVFRLSSSFISRVLKARPLILTTARIIGSGKSSPAAGLQGVRIRLPTAPSRLSLRSSPTAA